MKIGALAASAGCDVQTVRFYEREGLEKQLVSLRKSCDGDTSHPCAILDSFMSAAEEHACASRPG